MSNRSPSNGSQKIVIQGANDSTITVLVNGKVKEIRNDLNELKKLLEANQKQTFQSGEKIYNIGEIGQAEFQNITYQYYSESKISLRLRIFLTVLVPILAITLSVLIYRYFELKKPLSLTIQLFEEVQNKELPSPEGIVILTIGSEKFTKDIDLSGVTFNEIPSIYRDQTVRLEVEAKGFISKDTLIKLPNPVLSLSLVRNSDLALLKGNIKDPNGEPLEGVSIRIIDFDLQTSTDAFGQFTIFIPAENQRTRQRITVRKEGFKNQEFTSPVMPNETLRLILEKK